MSQLFVITRYKRAVGNDIDNYHEGRREQPLGLHQTCTLREQRRVAGCDEARGKRARSGGVAITNQQTNLAPLSLSPNRSESLYNLPNSDTFQDRSYIHSAPVVKWYRDCYDRFGSGLLAQRRREGPDKTTLGRFFDGCSPSCGLEFSGSVPSGRASPCS